MTAAPAPGRLVHAGVSLRLGALADAYRTGELTPVELVGELARRIAARGDDAVWIGLDLDGALVAAEALGEVPDPARPLWGIPFAVKDNIDIAGLPTTAACPAFGYLPDETATAVQRLLDAGAVLIGKTNLDQFATGLNGTRSPYGAPRAVDDDTLISGGSSSGSAVAVAAELVSFALGTDTAGSGRVPAALNGIVGHKPSRGLVSCAGVVPACRSLDCVSVFAQTVGDAVHVVEVMAGPDPRDAWSRALPSPRPRTVPPLRGLRLAVPSLVELDDRHGYATAWTTTLELLRSAGVELLELELDGFLEAGRLLYEGPWLAERLSTLQGFLAEHPDEVHPVTRELLERGAGVTGAEVFLGLDRLQQLRADAAAALAGVDALLTPTTPTTFTVDEMLADPIAHNTALGHFTTFGNLLDLAVIAIPGAGSRERRPFGVSLVGTAGSDAALAGIAMALEARFAGDSAAPVGEKTPESRLGIAVVGAHLRGMPLHQELLALGAQFRTRTTTAPSYRLVALDTTPAKPGLVRVDGAGHAIEVEIYELPRSAVGELLASIAAPLGLGIVELADGSRVHGFLCEAVATGRARDISAFGGWRAYLGAGSG